MFSTRFINAVHFAHAPIIAEQNDIQGALYPLSVLAALVQTSKLSFYKMDSQTKKEIIADISVTATKTIEQAVRDSLKRAFPHEFLDKTTDETIKQIKSLTIPEFKGKGNKIRYKVDNNILQKIDDAMNVIEKGHIERCQERLKEGKTLILKQQKLIRIADRGGGWMGSREMLPIRRPVF